MNNSTDTSAITIEELQDHCAKLEQQNTELTTKLNWLMEQFRLGKHKQFGSSSEKTAPGQEQFSATTQLRNFVPVKIPSSALKIF
jgi:uncharacterized coiled-coil protein SlyX